MTCTGNRNLDVSVAYMFQNTKITVRITATDRVHTFLWLKSWHIKKLKTYIYAFIKMTAHRQPG